MKRADLSAVLDLVTLEVLKPSNGESVPTLTCTQLVEPKSLKLHDVTLESLLYLVRTYSVRDGNVVTTLIVGGCFCVVSRDSCKSWTCRHNMRVCLRRSPVS